MGIKSKRINNASDFVKELKAKVEGLSVVVLDVPGREANADLIKELAGKMNSL